MVVSDRETNDIEPLNLSEREDVADRVVEPLAMRQGDA
jgi:hypothetical protein